MSNCSNIVNLLMNGAEAMAHVMGSKDLLVSSRNSDDGAAVVVAVHDSGRGIAGQDLLKMFDAFFTTRADGIGIGLSLAAQLLRPMAAASGPKIMTALG